MMDKTELERCTTYKRNGRRCTISCNLGLWSVSGEYGMDLISEASRYFEQYKSGGEYSSIIGGESVADKLMKNINSRGE